MDELSYLIKSLNDAKSKMGDAATLLGCLDKQKLLEDFEVGYEQAWMESAMILIAMSAERLSRYTKINQQDNKFGLQRKNG